jgi:GT2 family glycosyltransferase
MNFNPLHHPIIYQQSLQTSPAPQAEHLPFVLFLVSILRPQLLVEVGPQANGSRGISGITFENLATNARHYVVSDNNSENTGTPSFADSTVDLLQLDGLRSLETVKRDFDAWLPKLSHHGIVLLHGINADEIESGGKRLWADLKARYPHFEFLQGNGLGVLAAGTVAPPELQDFFDASEQEVEQIRAFFSTLGQQNKDLHAYRELQAYHEQREQYYARREREFAETAATLKQQNVRNEEAWHELQSQLTNITSSRGWQLLLWLWRLRRQLAPENTARKQMLQLAIRAARFTVSRLLPGGSASRQLSEYNEWIAQNEAGAEELEQQKTASEKFDYRPLISFITPVYNTPPRLLEEMIQSVLDQTYTHWQLCLADGNSANEETRAVLQKWADKDPRIIVRHLEQNLGISGNSNAALALAEGEFIALLDHDDLLAPFALHEVVKRLNEQPELDFIYSDRDLVSEDSKQRFGAFFKPGWSPEIMLAANYLCHLCVIRRKLAEKVGGFNAATDGAQDWDFFLRIMECTNRFAHIPQVLYHWRQWSNSAASGMAAKPYAIAAQKRAVREHLQRQGLAADTDIYPGGFVRATWPVAGNTRASVILLAENNLARPTACLESLLKHTGYRNFEVLVARREGEPVASINGFRELAPDIPLKLLTYQQAVSFPAAYNFAAQQATGELLLFLSATNEIAGGGWLEEMVRWAEYPGVGIVGAKLVEADGKIKHAGILLGQDGEASYPMAGTLEGNYDTFGSTEWYRNWQAVAGDCLLIKKQLFLQLGGFEEGSANSDLALCLKAHSSGWRVVYTPYAKLKHSGPLRRHFVDGGKAQAELLAQASQAGDPYFNPNLLLAGPVIKLKRERGGDAF